MESDQPQNPEQPPIVNTPPPVTPPPQAYKAPPIIPPFATAARKSGTSSAFRVIACVLAGIVLVFSLLLNLTHALTKRSGVGKALASSGGYGARLEEVTVRDTDGATGDKILVIPITGVIMSEPAQRGDYGMVTLVKEQLRRAKKDSNVKAVILKVDSPGGEVLASDDIANAIKQFETNCSPRKPVVVSMGSLAASGGYYVSAPCDWIVANELTITGSIGVIMHGYNYRGLLDKIGVRPDVYKSGKFKDMLSGTKSDSEIDPEERRMVLNLITETYEKFKEVVADGRHASNNAHKDGKPLSADWTNFADGRILSGREALKLGFVDELGDFDAAIQRTKNLAGISKAELVEYQPIFDFANIFRMFGETHATAIKLDLGMDIPKLKPGCTYFIMPTSLP